MSEGRDGGYVDAESGILAIPPGGGWGGEFLYKVKNREEFEGGLEKRKGKGGKEEKKEKSDKTHVKIPL